MKFLISGLVVGFLEKDIGSDACILKLPVIFHGGCRNIDIDTADGTIFLLFAVNGVDTLQDVLNGIVHRILSCLDRQTLMTHILQGRHLFDDFLLSQLLSGKVLIFQMIGSVYAAVHTVIGKIQRCKKHNAVSVEILLDLLGQLVYLLNLLLIFTG